MLFFAVDAVTVGKCSLKEAGNEASVEAVSGLFIDEETMSGSCHVDESDE